MYELKPFSEVKNQRFTFHKLTVDDRCPFEEFEDGLCQPSDTKALGAIYSLMECFGNQLLPKTKFNHLDGGKKDPDNVFEFKKNNIRVYVLLQKPDVVVVLGGFKATQKKDINKVFAIAREWMKRN
ncbi:MAG TPA: hypothetical protein DCR26_09385 [Porphyromonadaceae bacterium]|nr:hypothetical protein [Porphyromonadaceae bacterium]